MKEKFKITVELLLVYMIFTSIWHGTRILIHAPTPAKMGKELAWMGFYTAFLKMSIQSFVYLLLTFLILWGYVKWVENKSLAEINIRIKSVDFLYFILYMIIIPIHHFIPVAGTYELSEFFKKIAIIDIGSVVQFLLYTSVYAGANVLRQELIFRGLIQRRLCQKWGGRTGLMLATIFFALTHLYIKQIVFAFVVGLIYGYAYLKTKRLGSAILMHWGNNTLAHFLVWVIEY